MSAQTFERLVLGAVSFLMLLAVATVSFGGVAQVEAQQKPRVSLRFDRLEATQQGSRLTIDYAFDRNDWSALKKAKIEPRMDLYLPARQGSKTEHHSGYTLSQMSGQVVFQRVPETTGQREVGIRVVESKGRNRIGQLSFGRQKGDEVRVSVRSVQTGRPSQPARPSRPVEPSRPAEPSRPHRPSRPVEPARPHRPSRPVEPARPHRPSRPVEPSRPAPVHPHRPSRDSQVDIIEACKRNTTFSSDMEKCLADAKQLRGYQVVQVINACGQYRHGLSECMRSSARLPEHEDVAIIHACGQNSTFRSDMTSCLDIAGGFRQQAAPVIQACGQATSFSSDMQACMRTTSTYRRPAAPIVQACARASTFSSDLIKCLEQSR